MRTRDAYKTKQVQVVQEIPSKRRGQGRAPNEGKRNLGEYRKRTDVCMQECSEKHKVPTAWKPRAQGERHTPPN